jgi:Ca2+-binding RTX toxin-like protein
MTGGPGADRFVLSDAAHSTVAAPDQILDFDQAAGDRIDLSAIDAIAGGMDDPFSFVAGGAFNSTAGSVIVVNHAAGKYRVEGDINGDNLADFAIIVTAPLMPDAGAFIL